MKKLIVIIGIAAICFSLAAVAVYLHRAYKIADIISDKAAYDMIEKGYRSLSVDEYEKAIADTSVFRLDVRTEEERRTDGFIPGTVMIDVQKDDFTEKACEILPKDRTIAVNCRSGRRSKIAAEKLVGLGYDVIELDKGFNAWKDAGKPVVIE